MIDFTSHPQYKYTQNVHSFQTWRLKYYTNNYYFENKYLKRFLEQDVDVLLDDFNLSAMMSRLNIMRPDITIITCTYNRGGDLNRLYKTINSQVFNGTIAWVVIDNGSENETKKIISDLSLVDDRVFYITYKKPFDYASPARNRGLAFVQLSLSNLIGERYIMIIDSDDRLHNEFALSELYKVAKQNINASMIHGYAVCEYENRSGKVITINTIPRYIGKNFPSVNMLKDEFDAGPQILASIIPVKYLGWFYYPDEFTFEDDTLNRKIMAWCKIHKVKQKAVNFPITIKRFHFDSLSQKNSQLGDQTITCKLGPTVVKGLRAQLVLGLLKLRDYFTREDV